MKEKIKKSIRHIKDSVSKMVEVVKLPQCITVFILIILSVLSITFSWKFNDTAPFVSSVLSNVFAGLVTGVAICIISGVKNVHNYDMTIRLSFLQEIHEECLEYMNMRYKMLGMIKHQASDGENFWNYTYDVLCQGHNINCIISQSQFDKTKPFNLCEFFKNEMNYDVTKQMQCDDSLRDKILFYTGSSISEKELFELFSDMTNNISDLNSQILKKINEYKVQQNLSQKTIF